MAVFVAIVVAAGATAVKQAMDVAKAPECAALSPDDWFLWWWYSCGKDEGGGGGSGAGN